MSLEFSTAYPVALGQVTVALPHLGWDSLIVVGDNGDFHIPQHREFHLELVGTRARFPGGIGVEVAKGTDTLTLTFPSAHDWHGNLYLARYPEFVNHVHASEGQDIRVPSKLSEGVFSFQNPNPPAVALANRHLALGRPIMPRGVTFVGFQRAWYTNEVWQPEGSTFTAISSTIEETPANTDKMRVRVVAIDELSVTRYSTWTEIDVVAPSS